MTARTNTSGFTLVELMIALGILGVGVVMIGTAFPAGMLENRDSIEDTFATTVSENAAAICRLRLSHGLLDAVLDARVLAPAPRTSLVDVSDLIPLAERAYPDARDRTAYPQDWIRSPVDNQYYPAARYGWFVAACQPAGDNVNDYLLIIVPYRKFLPTDRPGAEIQFQSANVAGTPPVVNLPYLNSPVVATMPPPPAWSGTFTFVTGITGVNGSLANTAFPAGAALVVGSSVAGRTVSPAIGCYPVRLGLRP